MARCDTCDQDTSAPLTVTHGDRSGTFDSFECAVHAMAPTCVRCGVRVLGHGWREGPDVYCCRHCAAVVARNIGRWKDDGGAVLP